MSSIPELIGRQNGRLKGVFAPEELSAALAETGIAFGEDLLPVSGFTDPRATLDAYLDGLMRAKGPLWPALIQGEVVTALAAAGMPIPALYRDTDEELSRALDGQVALGLRLRRENLELQQSMIEALDEQIKDPVTGFYNEEFFKEYLEAGVPQRSAAGKVEDTVLFIRLDDIQRLNQRFGAEAGDGALKGLGHILLNNKRENGVFFRMGGPLFSCYMSGCGKDAAYEYAKHLQQRVAESNEFIQNINISAAIVDLAEMDPAHLARDLVYAGVMKVAKERIAILNKLGPGSICRDSEISLRRSSGTVLLIEENAFEAELMRRLLERGGFEAHGVANGGQAVPAADLHRPDVIVSEMYVSQMDGFQIRQRLLESQDLKHIPFVLVSRGKDPVAVDKAFALGIRHFFKKPVMPAELLGTIAALIKDAASERR